MDDEGRRVEEERRRERERAAGGAKGSATEAARARDQEEREHERRIRRDRRSRLVKALAILTLVVLFVVFIAQNIDTRPTIRFLSLEWDISIIWIFIAVAFLGGLVGYLLGRPSRRLRLHDDPKDPKKGGRGRQG